MAIKTKKELVARLQSLQANKLSQQEHLEAMTQILGDLVETTFARRDDLQESDSAGAQATVQTYESTAMALESGTTIPSEIAGPLTVSNVDLGEGIFLKDPGAASLLGIINKGNLNVGYQSQGDMSFDTNGNVGMLKVSQDGTVITNSLGLLRVNDVGATGGGIAFAQEGDIVTSNDGFCALRFTNGVKIYNASGGGDATITLRGSGSLEFSGAATPGITGSATGPTKLDPNGQRFVIPVPAAGITLGNTVFTVEDSATGQQTFSLKANGNVTVRDLQAEQVRLEVATGEKQIRWMQNGDNGWGIYGHSGEMGIYDWVNNKSLMRVTRNDNAINFFGNLQTSGNITAFSDGRLKANVKKYENGLEKVMRLKPVSYDRRDVKKKDEVGFIAQEVREVEPDLVFGDEETGTLSLDYSRMVVLLTKALQEQQQQIEELKLRLTIVGQA